jgi:hypothetical protein
MKWRLIKFIDDNAVLENTEGQKVSWPHNQLPIDYNIGDEFEIQFSKGNKTSSDDESKQIINTILQSE